MANFTVHTVAQTLTDGEKAVARSNISALHSKILYVDTAGNNSTAVVGREDLPYLTPLAAQSAAVAGDTIIVRPGSYSGATLGSVGGINWFWMPGSSYSTSGSIATWVLSGTYNVQGSGRFIASGTSTPCVQTNNNSSGTFIADLVQNDGTGGGFLTSDSCEATIRKIVTASYDGVLLFVSNNVNARVHINVGIISSGGDAVSLEQVVGMNYPAQIRIGSVIRCGGYLVNEEAGSACNGHIFIEDCLVVPGEAVIFYTSVPTTTRIILGHWRLPLAAITELVDAGAYEFGLRLTVLDGAEKPFNSLSSNPTASIIAPGYCRVVKNTTNNEVRLWANDGGTMKSVLLT